jgi:hypothetical protein
VRMAAFWPTRSPSGEVAKVGFGSTAAVWGRPGERRLSAVGASPAPCGVTMLALARPLVDIHPALLLGAVAVLAAELRGVHPIILIGAATLLGAVTGFYIL